LRTAPAARRIVDALARQHPGAETELHYRNPFELLVATVLSAQSTDARVNSVTPALFAQYPDATTMSRAGAAALESMIRSTGFFRQKARSLIGLAQGIANSHGGRVPASMDALTALPGVGRKTANVVLGHALGVPGFPVDRHVLRVSERVGLADGTGPGQVESELCALLPAARWTQASDILILHGRRVCKPVPICAQCTIRQHCDYVSRIASSDSHDAPSVRTTGH
jgi:endonuclease-3